MRCRCNQLLLFSALAVFIVGCVSPRRTSINGSGPGPTTSPTPGPFGSPTPTPTLSPTPTPTASPMFPMSKAVEVQLVTRSDVVISGVEVQLSANFEQRPDRTRLDGRLADINIPVGSAVSFCLMHEGQTRPLAVGIIQPQGQGREAEFHIGTDQGQDPPSVMAGDVLQARDGANVNMADCSRPLLVAGTLVPDTNSGSGTTKP